MSEPAAAIQKETTPESSGNTPQEGGAGATIRILVLVSGGGTNLQALIDAQAAGKLGPASITSVISDREGVYALERARLAGIPFCVMAPDKTLPKPERRLEHSNRILAHANGLGIDLIVLAGYLQIFQGPILEHFEHRIINLHPALLPAYGGEGMYGDNVHRAVLAAGEKESGCSVHFVDDGTDTGEVILQRRVPVLEGDTIETLASRIHAEEHRAIVEAVQRLCAASTPATRTSI
mgnify:CR=1 FL=1